MRQYIFDEYYLEGKNKNLDEALKSRTQSGHYMEFETEEEALAHYTKHFEYSPKHDVFYDAVYQDEEGYREDEEGYFNPDKVRYTEVTVVPAMKGRPLDFGEHNKHPLFSETSYGPANMTFEEIAEEYRKGRRF